MKPPPPDADTLPPPSPGPRPGSRPASLVDPAPGPPPKPYPDAPPTSGLIRPTHPGRPVHVSSGLIPAPELRATARPSTQPLSARDASDASPAPRAVSRPAPRSTRVLGSAPPPLPSSAPSIPAQAPPPDAALNDLLAALAPTQTTSDRRAASASLPRPRRLHAATGPLSAPPGTTPFASSLDQRIADLPLSRLAGPLPEDRRLTAPALALDAQRETIRTQRELPPDQRATVRVAPLRPGAPATRPLSTAAHDLTRAISLPRSPRALRLLALAAFVLGLVLPTTQPPWLLLESASGPTALALAGLLLLPSLVAGPQHLGRWALRLLATVTLTALATLALTDTLQRPPWGDALDPLHGALTALGLTLLVGAAMTRSAHPSARVATLMGAVLLLAAALIPGPTGLPVAPVFAALDAPRSTADLVAALSTLVFAAAALTTTALRLLGASAARPLAYLTWLLALVPMVAHTALSTPPEAWAQALHPLKATLVFAGALLLCADALAPALDPEPPHHAPSR